MKIEMVKMAGGSLAPVSDLESEKMQRFKNGEQYSVEIKLSRNPDFHRKVFAFFGFCFEHWSGGHEFHCEQRQFDVFRAHLTVLAGFYESYHGIDGRVRIEAKSISYSATSQEEFEQLYTALINAAIKHIFKGCDDAEIYEKLMRFF